MDGWEGLINQGRAGGDGASKKQSRDRKQQGEKRRNNKPSFTADNCGEASHNKLDIHSEATLLSRSP